MVKLEKMATEKQNPNTLNLDQMSVKEALTVMNKEDEKVTEAIEEVIPEIESAVHVIIKQLRKGGRLIYTGAGTSGRLGVLDASECPPTFGTPKEKVVGLIAGGERAFTEAIEGAEDSQELGKEDLIKIELNNNDVVVGLAASGRTPYVIGALNYANEIDVPTIAIACNKNTKIGQAADIAIEAVPGPEVLTGSTRLKAGSTQKMILNMLSTIAMVGIGKVYKNLMVDVQPTNEKLVTRAENIVMKATDVEREEAKKALADSNGKVKVAIIMILLNINEEEAVKKLEESEGHVRRAL
ncbi:MAG: N-acetylmuramic acid 6-phosphate etherase [Alkalibacterium sp.]|uniref:N-acetylmuramic acid 6-phosphate etherase n=1 Tax=Alkalibacterium gilvum TaxID=1130080 RepID=A0A1H6VFH3_9LACT|nr:MULTISPECIES: N-acetylmuramic acid 6-phosphate etherase [Alkalibacterium]MDN6193586.1 N-acetylmuramic acid 6-phosphate etherase [Alkalibacterium sp.]MDN6293754.1 N-acetylmuramic acid 6-phosphate etherase [Alkalibacterium sp.]MDN6294893.1 N-acetylmuramic acid 6-phosphate etherase [Alkalibacterium sp.]MDN6326467.1 N-acetylmuramic acid 6-phosphate etherase [Alkalibacterium sp.]MDN6729213.1 N-acetylmuramic acid 6-phosphate etherase [Alkalibacterium sp.]